MAEQMQQIDTRRLRIIGGGMILAGLVLLRIVH